jgi:sugar fermentation stimulation protein A
VARFPDAPTERGVKHLKELTALAGQGISAYVLFIIQMKGVHVFRPNDHTHRAFGDALREAQAAGVRVLAVDCLVSPDTVTADTPIPVELAAEDAEA